MPNPILPQLIKSNLPSQFDLVICSASFESRCQKIIDAMNSQLECKKFAIFFNSNEYVEIPNTASDLVARIPNSIKIELNTESPVENAIIINKTLSELIPADTKNVFLDISTFTHETLLIIFKMLYEKRDLYSKLFIGYVGAKDYSTDEADLNKKWLSSGISSIRSIVGYPGLSSPARENHLIVLVGFEADRTQNLIDSLQFDRISLGLGDQKQSVDSCHHSLNYNRHLTLMDKYKNAEKFSFSVVDPFKAKEDILNQLNKFPNFNTVIAPMNTKISTIGAGLVAIDNSKVQLIYAKPAEYNKKGYAEPREDIYLFEGLF